jgi:4-hydroxyacetophenone monooxygenase
MTSEVARHADHVDDDALTGMIAQADLPSLLATLAHIGREPSLLEPALRLEHAKQHEPQGGWNEEQQQRARDLALPRLKALRDAGWPQPPRPDAVSVAPIMRWMTDEEASDEYLPLLLAELGDPRHDLRAPHWTITDVAPGRTMRVAVVGAGMSGLLAAHRLHQIGADVTVFDKNADVGGTWLENTYPGCRVDVTSHLFCYSFAQRDDWPQHYSTQPELLEYFRQFAAQHDLIRFVRFNTEVLGASFDDDTASWRVRTRGADGTLATQGFDAVVSATGQLNRPKFPNIPGRDSFAGPSFHSARWDHTVDLRGKRVAVIGTGASAAQFIPIVAEQAAQLFIFQRTPNWLMPTLEYHDDVPAGQRSLLTHLPYYSQWYRFWLFWRYAEGMLPRVAVDPSWSGNGRSVSAANDELRELFSMWLTMTVGDRADLMEKVQPQYPPGAKRMVRDNGVWAATLSRHNVALITDPIAAIEPSGVCMEDGVLHDVDVIVYATGFHASKFLTPMAVTGRGGADLHQQWGADARAYLGIVVPQFPNLFILYGPNTNIVVNGSIIYFSECEVNYVVECLHHLVSTGARAMDCRPEVHQQYAARIDAGNAMMAWGAAPEVNSWYKSDSGKIAQNWPFSLREFWAQTRSVRADDYELL